MSIVSEIMRYATPLVVDRIASAIGINSSLARMALTYALPAILSAFSAKAATPSGASALLSAVRNTDPNMLGSLENVLGGPGQKQFLQNGSSVLGSLLGQGGVNNLVSSLGNQGGLGSTAAAALLPIVGQMALGGLAKSTAGMDANGLASLLSSQSSSFAANTPNVTVPKPATGAGLLRWALPALAAAALAWYFMAPSTQMTQNTTPAATTDATAPASGSLVVGGVDIGKSVTDTLGGLTTTLGGITDAATAAAAVPKLQDATTSIEGLSTVAGKLDAGQKTALSGMLAMAVPAARAAADKALAIEGVGPIAKPILDTLFAKVEALAK